MQMPKFSAVGVIAGIIVFFAVMAVLFTLNPRHVGFQQSDFNITARQAILDDARIKYPSADVIDIVNVTEGVSGGEGYSIVKVRVTEEYNSTCPKRYHLEYFYPKQKFEPSKPILMTNDCSLCADGKCVVAFEEEAIIASVSAPGTKTVRSFVTKNGATPKAYSSGDNWQVIWAAQNSSVEVDMANTGAINSIKYS
jgi:hypothetical protein